MTEMTDQSLQSTPPEPTVQPDLATQPEPSTLSMLDTQSRWSTQTPRDTRLSILGGVAESPGQADYQQAWSRFHEQYADPMYRWCRSAGLAAADAEDAVQATLVKLVTLLQSFPYDRSRSFRAWLATVTRRTACDIVRSRGRKESPEDPTTFDDALTEESLTDHLDTIMERELIGLARDRARAKLAAGRSPDADRNWAVFTAVADEEEDPAAVAERFGISRPNVYVIRNRVLSAIREEYDALSATPGDEDAEATALTVPPKG